MDRRFLKPGWLVGHLLVLIAVLVCLRLGVWQWHRTHDPDGTVQNLAYAILWPAFAIGFIYMWVRFLQLEKIRDVDDDRRLDEGLTAILTDGIEPGVAGGADGQPVSPTAAPHRPEGNEADDPPEPENVDAVHPDEQQPVERPDVFVGSVDDIDDDDDPELAAYNRRLAALAQEDHRRAH